MNDVTRELKCNLRNLPSSLSGFITTRKAAAIGAAKAPPRSQMTAIMIFALSLLGLALKIELQISPMPLTCGSLLIRKRSQIGLTNILSIYSVYKFSSALIRSVVNFTDNYSTRRLYH